VAELMQSIPLGVVVERREVDHPWQDHAWIPVAVIPGAPQIDEWRELDSGPTWVRYHCATLTLELHRKETEAYLVNLADAYPRIFVILTDAEDPAHDIRAFLVTASPFEAQDYLDSSEDIIEGVPMPDGVIGWVRDFIDRHHVEEPFKKRKQKHYRSEQSGFGRPPEIQRKDHRGDG
jgi:hypothetical protein